MGRAQGFAIALKSCTDCSRHRRETVADRVVERQACLPTLHEVHVQIAGGHQRGTHQLRRDPVKGHALHWTVSDGLPFRPPGQQLPSDRLTSPGWVSREHLVSEAEIPADRPGLAQRFDYHHRFAPVPAGPRRHRPPACHVLRAPL